MSEQQVQDNNGLVINPPEASQTPQQVEQNLVKAEKSPLEGLADKIHLLRYPFCNVVDGLSNKSLRRLIKALVLMPLEDKIKPNLKRKEEEVAWRWGEEILMAKMTIIHHSLLEHEIKKEQERQALAVQTPNSVVESKNEQPTVSQDTITKETETNG